MVKTFGSKHPIVSLSLVQRNVCCTNKSPTTNELTYYYPLSIVGFWQGIKYINTDMNLFVICGTTRSNLGVFYVGGIETADPKQYFILLYPGSNTTSIYGPNLYNNIFSFVGAYTVTNGAGNSGFLYTNDLTTNTIVWTQIQYDPFNLYTFVHSVMGNLCILNTDSRSSIDPNNDLAKAYICDITDVNNLSFTNFSFPNALTTTVYGLWWNGGTSYTIVGGFSDKAAFDILEIYKFINSGEKYGFISPIGKGYIVDYDSNTKIFKNFTEILIPSSSSNLVLTHIQGISGIVGFPNTYKLACTGLIDSLDTVNDVVTVERNNTFGRFDVTNNYILNQFGTNIITSVANNGVTGANLSTGKPVPYTILIP